MSWYFAKFISLQDGSLHVQIPWKRNKVRSFLMRGGKKQTKKKDEKTTIIIRTSINF